MIVEGDDRVAMLMMLCSAFVEVQAQCIAHERDWPGESPSGSMTCASCPKSDFELNGVSPDPGGGEQAPARPTLRGARGRVVFPGKRLFLDL